MPGKVWATLVCRRQTQACGSNPIDCLFVNHDHYHWLRCTSFLFFFSAVQVACSAGMFFSNVFYMLFMHHPISITTRPQRSLRRGRAMQICHIVSSPYLCTSRSFEVLENYGRSEKCRTLNRQNFVLEALAVASRLPQRLAAAWAFAIGSQRQSPLGATAERASSCFEALE